jgi:hypothetical protein
MNDSQTGALVLDDSCAAEENQDASDKEEKDGEHHGPLAL